MIGCLLIHGFTGSPYEVEPLAEHFAETTEWRLAIPTLAGHGEDGDLKGVTYKEWLDSAESELVRLKEHCETVYVVGFSMGGLIAGHLAAQYDVQKLVLLSAAAYYVNPKQMVSDIVDMMKDGLKGDLQDNDLYLRYRRKIGETPFSATIQFQQLVKALRPSLKKIKAPTLIIQGESDGLIPKKSAEFLYETIASKEKRIHYLPKSKHIVCHDVEKEQVIKLVDSFLRK